MTTKKELRIMLPEDVYGALVLEATASESYKGSGVRYSAMAFTEELLTRRYAEGGEGHHWLQQHIGEEQAKAQAVKEFREKLKGIASSTTEPCARSASSDPQ